jgi:hypothetical protein
MIPSSCCGYEYDLDRYILHSLGFSRDDHHLPDIPKVEMLFQHLNPLSKLYNSRIFYLSIVVNKKRELFLG